MNRKTKTKKVWRRFARMLAFLLMCQLPAKADDARIVIKQKGGGDTIIELSQNPVITFSCGDMVVTSNLTTITIPLDDVDYYTFSKGTTTIVPVVNTPQFADGHVVFQGLSKSAEVCIYSLDGKLVSKQTADHDGRASVSLNQFPKGVYVISAGGRKTKVMNK